MANALLNVVLKSLNSLIEEEIGLLWGVDKEMEKLSSTLSTIQAVLEDAELKQLQDKALQDWLRKLKHAAYAVDDILDECATEAIPLKSKGKKSGLLGKVHSCFLPYTPDNIIFRHKIGNKMKEITEKLDAIANERMKFHLRELVAPQQVQAVERRQTGSLLSQLPVYGREKDKAKFVEKLVEGVSDCECVSVYPIIGMGGLGKTTLAQLVFNDEKVIGHFDPRIWVCVSENFNVKRVIKAILESASGNGCEDLDLDPLQRRLQHMLKRKRYLLVLDDVWNEKQEEWDKLKCVLACGSKGASIITTTRLPTVASIMGTLPAHHLSTLSEDDCWLLFKQRAFGSETEEDPNLVTIGKEIVKKSRGVPLAAKALGGLLFKRGETQWLSVKESEIWNLPQDEDSILPVLRLSYYNLSLELRQCFAYCAIFEKDSWINKEKLIHFWIANGFISSNKKLELEDIGNEIWNELYWRSFFQDLKEVKVHNITIFKMHDLVHDLAQSIMGDECRLRTYTFSYRFGSLLSFEFKKFSSLRVLDASRTYMEELPSWIGSLKHLRYLNLSKTDICTLPETICDLWNLQILNLSGCWLLKRLPKTICDLWNLQILNLSGCHRLKRLPKIICDLWNLQILNLNGCWGLKRLPKNLTCLRNLRHLYLAGFIDMPLKIGQLTCLKTLDVFRVGKLKGCQLSELKDLDLGGRLKVANLERVGNLMEAQRANFIGKPNLRHLELSWESGCELRENVEQVLEGLQPHPNLERLEIDNYNGTRFPLWMGDSVLRNLSDINLSNCPNCLLLPPFGQLPSLRCLSMSTMNALEYIDNEFHGRAAATRRFPSLEVLEIDGLLNLTGLFKDERTELFPRLHKMHITSCPKLMLPCLPSLEELTIRLGSEVLLSSISNLSTLISFEIVDNFEVVFFPEKMLQNLTVLEKLKIVRYKKLKVLPTTLANLISLKSIDIYDCPKLESLSEQSLPQSLQRLSIAECSELKSVSLQHLSGLETLDSEWGPELRSVPASLISLNVTRFVSFPEDMLQNLTALESLKIKKCCNKLQVLPTALANLTSLKLLHISSWSELESLPEQGLRGLQSLRRLEIFSCDKLRSLSEGLQHLTALEELVVISCPELGSLPAGIQSLTKLHLSIDRCPKLARRCEKGKGEDWYKIAHLPGVYIE